MRGWLCEKDNMSGGKLGDSLQSACNWIAYLVAAEKNYLDDKQKKHSIELVIDRLLESSGFESSRVLDSVEIALRWVS